MQYQRYKVERPKGVNFTQEPAQLPDEVWDNVDQVAFRHGTTQKVSGYEQGFGKTGVLGDGSVVPDTVLPLRDDGGEYYWWAYTSTSPDTIHRIQSVDAHQDVTPIAGIEDLPDYTWSGDSLNGVPYFTKGVPYKWDESANFEKFTKFPIHLKANTIRTYRNFMIALNIETERFDPIDYEEDDYYKDFGFWTAGKHQNAIWWSAGAIDKDIDVSWADADPTSESGWNFLGGTGGNIVDGKTLRDSFIIYRERSVWQMTYTGGVNVFSWKELFNDAGALSRDCVAEIEGNHLVVGQSDVYMHDGVSKRSIADGIIRKEIYRTIDKEHIDKVFIATRYKDKEAWICVPQAATENNGRCNIAFVYNWEEQTWSRREIPSSLCSMYTILDISEDDISWGAPSELEGVDGSTWQEATDTWMDSFFKYNPSDWGMAMGGVTDDGEGAVYTMIDAPMKDGKNFTGYVEKRWMDMGDRNLLKTINRIFPMVRGTGTMDIYVAGTMTTMEAPRWKYAGNYDPNRKMHLGTTATGKYIHVRFEWPKESRLEVKGYDVEYKITGAR